MLLRIDLSDPATAPTLESAAAALRDLSAARLMAVVEPFMVSRVDGWAVNDLAPTRSSSRSRSPRGWAAPRPTAGSSSRWSPTWSGWPPRRRCRRCCSAETRGDPDGMFTRWREGAPTAHGLAALSSAATCSTRPATTWPRPWTPRWACFDRGSAASPAGPEYRRGAVHRGADAAVAGWPFSSLRVVELGPGRRGA